MAKDDRALLAPAGVRRHVAAGELGAQVVPLRPDQAHAVPRLLLADVGDPAPIGRHQLLVAGIRLGRVARSGHASLRASR